MVTITQALDLAVKHHQVGQLREAEQLCRRVLQVDPCQVAALHLLGEHAQQMGRNDLAAAYISGALRFKSDYAEAHSNLGVALAEQGRLEEAVASYQQGLRLKPDHPDAHKNLALAWLSMGDFQRGWPEYEWRWK
jgi:Flp pilus assembly protein TadD